MIKLEFATGSDPGIQREENQDSVWAQVHQNENGEPIGLFIVCDGVGGHQGGQQASSWAVESIRSELSSLFSPSDHQRFLEPNSGDEEDSISNDKEITQVSQTRKLEELIIRAVHKTNKKVNEHANRDPEATGDAGTTLTMVVVQGNSAVIANVGDSRTYLLRDGQIRQITVDHSLVSSLVASGQLEPEQIYDHPQRNIIFQSLGQRNEVQVDTFIELLKPGDYLLLCSDGLWEMVRETATLAKLVADSPDPQQSCTRLISAANQAGGFDNVSVAVVKVH